MPEVSEAHNAEELNALPVLDSEMNGSDEQGQEQEQEQEQGEPRQELEQGVVVVEVGI